MATRGCPDHAAIPAPEEREPYRGMPAGKERKNRIQKNISFPVPLSWYMEEGWQPEALRNRKLEQLRASMNDYIEKNIDRLETNLPVFFGHVAATLDKSFPDLDDKSYDEFIDAVTYTLLNTTRLPPTTEFLEKTLRHAMGNKRRRKGRATLDVIAALKLLNTGNYQQAIEYLSHYRSYDGRIITTIAYCLYILSTAANQTSKGLRPNDMELHAREEMLTLVRTRPPLNRLKIFDVKESQLNMIFWFMLDLAFTWFPSEHEFLRIGIRRARYEGDTERRRRLLAIATERFSDNKYFLIESFNSQIEQRNGSGAAGIVKQMMQQYPDDLEPIYFGLKLAILGSQPNSYASFRKLAILKQFPGYLLSLLDVAFEIMCNRKNEGYVCFEEVKRASGKKNYYLTALEYLLRDVIEGDEEQAKRAKFTLIASIDQYCMYVLNIQQD
jgi:hypothetical protein